MIGVTAVRWIYWGIAILGFVVAFGPELGILDATRLSLSGIGVVAFFFGVGFFITKHYHRLLEAGDWKQRKPNPKMALLGLAALGLVIMGLYLYAVGEPRSHLRLHVLPACFLFFAGRWIYRSN